MLTACLDAVDVHKLFVDDGVLRCLTQARLSRTDSSLEGNKVFTITVTEGKARERTVTEMAWRFDPRPKEGDECESTLRIAVTAVKEFQMVMYS